MKKRIDNNGKKYLLRGSFTVEASLIMPIVLSVMFLALKLGYASYDRMREIAEALETQEASDTVTEMYRLEKFTDIRGLIYGD